MTKKIRSKHIWMGVDSELQTELIGMLREFSDKGFKDFTTGFQRYYVIDIINLVLSYDHSDWHPDMEDDFSPPDVTDEEVKDLPD